MMSIMNNNNKKKEKKKKATTKYIRVFVVLSCALKNDDEKEKENIDIYMKYITFIRMIVWCFFVCLHQIRWILNTIS